MESILIAPIITEKSMNDVEKGKVTFQVARFADKTRIKQEIEKRFNVNVVDVATSIVKGRRQRIGARRMEKSLTAWKKAIVTLKKGQKIDLFELGA